MMDSQWLAFAGVVFLLIITPGADTMLVIRNVLTRGPGAGVITTIGGCGGLLVHALISALGLSVILVHSATAFEIVKLLGAGYLIYLGLATLRRSADRTETSPAAARISGPGGPKGRIARSLWEGLLSNVLNPKVAVFYLAFLPHFIDPGDSVMIQSLLLAGIHMGLKAAWFSCVSIFLGWMGAVATRPTVARRARMFTGGLLVAFGVRLAVERG